MRLINNGYVVQDLNWSIFDQNSYKGVQKFKSWPLAYGAQRSFQEKDLQADMAGYIKLEVILDFF